MTLGTALLPLQSTQVLNKSLLLHTGNLVKPAKLQSVALRDLSNEADSILGMTQELDAIPVLLAPDDISISESRESNATLHGEERSLKDAVSRYVQTLASISDEEINIPAVRPDSDLGKALQAVIDNNELISNKSMIVPSRLSSRETMQLSCRISKASSNYTVTRKMHRRPQSHNWSKSTQNSSNCVIAIALRERPQPTPST